MYREAEEALPLTMPAGGRRERTSLAETVASSRAIFSSSSCHHASRAIYVSCTNTRRKGGEKHDG